ncbi:MAG: glycosyltransferase family 2 protein [Pseudorhodoplanes sp.]|uniref:glycosyltransferase n=1 Tax=Pseudorhodoplanes sp. TaxID=1934341 RepID=UPI003D13CDB3
MEYLYLLPLALWVFLAAVACYGVYDCISTLKPPPRIDWRPDNIVLIIPVRHVPPNFFALWDAIRAQNLPPTRVIFAVEDLEDPAAAAVLSFKNGPPVELIASGPTAARAQKVHNLLAALDTLRPEDDVIVFADADIIPKPDWIQRLVVPLKNREIYAVSGYRWMTPSDDAWSSAVVCVANASVATVPRWRYWDTAWGGSTALRRDTLDALDLPNHWKNLVLDDVPFTQAVKALGGYITSPQSLLVPSPIAWDWSTAFAFGRRQYLLARWFATWLWLVGAAGTTIPLIGWAVALPYALAGNGFAIAAILVANALDQVRASLRLRVSRILWNEEMPRRMALIDRFATPVSLGFHAAVVWSTLFSYSITWGGRTYRVDPRGRVLRIDVHPS